MTDISVVITTHNRIDLLPRAIHSVIEQSCPPDQIIIVDDGSTDQTSNMVSNNYPQLDYYFQENRGISRARNTGILASTSDWIAFLDDDDEWLPDKLKKQFECITDNADAKLAHTNEIWIKNGRRIEQMKKHRKRGGMIFRHCLPLCCISPSTALIHRSVFDHIGMFDESLPACEDYDMWMRICARYPVLFIDEPLVLKYGGHAGQLSKKYWGMDRFRILALEKILNDPQLEPDNYHAAAAMLDKKAAIYLKGAKKYNNNKYIRHFETLLDKYAREYQPCENKA